VCFAGALLQQCFRVQMSMDVLQDDIGMLHELQSIKYILLRNQLIGIVGIET
jgi:hypothetical protein